MCSETKSGNDVGDSLVIHLLNNGAYCLFNRGGELFLRVTGNLWFYLLPPITADFCLPFTDKISSTGVFFNTWYHSPQKKSPPVFCHRHKSTTQYHFFTA